MIKALEDLRNVAAASAESSSALIESTTERVIAELQKEQPEEPNLRKMFTGIGEIVRTIGKFGPAWKFVALDAAKVGVHIPVP